MLYFGIALVSGIIITYGISCINALHYNHPVYHHRYVYILAVIAFYLFIESIGYVSGKIDKKLSWYESIKKRFRIQLFITIPYTFIFWVITSLFITFVVAGDTYIDGFGLLLYLSVGIIISLVYCIVLLIYYSVRKRENMMQKLKFEKEDVQTKYESLKDQLSPHFLFNNLHTLHGLIQEDQKSAADFVIRLSDIYRYVLQAKENELVTIESEIAFIHKYLDLIKIRYGSCIISCLAIDLDKEKYYLPPLTLHTLVDNVQKHNAVDEGHVVKIDIYNEHDDYLVIRNNLNKSPDQVISLKTGLSNLTSRYSYLSNTRIEISSDDTYFTVKVPLIQLK